MSSLYPREDCPGQNSGNVRCSCLSYEVMSDRGLEGRPGPESSLTQRHLQRCHGRLVPVALAGPHVTKKRVRALPGLDRVSHACVLRFLATTHNAFHFQRPERLHAFKGGGCIGLGAHAGVTSPRACNSFLSFSRYSRGRCVHSQAAAQSCGPLTPSPSFSRNHHLLCSLTASPCHSTTAGGPSIRGTSRCPA